MLRIGITGGIASGKSAVDAYLTAQGVPVLDADQVACQVVAPGSPILAAIDQRFPGVVVDGRLDRRAMGAIIFADPEARRDLERIEHPEILRRMGAFLNVCAERGEPLAAIDAALLLESGGDALVDEVWVVHAELPVRIARLMARDNIDAQQAQRRIDAQMDEGERLARADRVIENSGNLADTHGQLRAILDALERK